MKTGYSKPSESIGTIGFALGPKTKSQELLQKIKQIESREEGQENTVDFFPKTMISVDKGPNLRHKFQIWAKSVH